MSRAPAAARALLATLLGLALAAPRASAQSGSFFDDFGVGARGAAMGSAMTGVADDATASYYNPAGLSWAPVETTVGWRYAKMRPTLTTDDPDQPKQLLEVPSARGFALQVKSALDHEGINEKFPWIEPLSLGVSIFVSLREVSSFRTFKSNTQPYYFRYDTRPDVLTLNFSLAYRITDWLSIGGGVLPNVNSFQDNRAQVRLIFPEDDPTGGTDLQLEQEASAEMAPVAGIMVKPPFWGLQDKLSLGFSYRGEIKNFFGTGKSDQGLGFRLENGGFVELVFIPGDIVNLVGFVPEQYSVGLGYRPTEDWVIGFDATYKVWERWRYWVDLPPEPSFDNTITWRLGTEYRVPVMREPIEGLRLESLDVRFGYVFEPTPVPSQDGRFNILDADQHVLSAGLGFATRVLEKWGIRYDLLFQVHLIEDRRIANDADPLYGPFELGGEVYQLGVDLRFDF